MMSEQASLFHVGDRVKYDNGHGYDPRWYYGVIAAVKRGTAIGYRVDWEDGYVDPPGAPLYFAGGLERA
jgi:hypothetical protein